MTSSWMALHILNENFPVLGIWPPSTIGIYRGLFLYA